MGLRPIQYVLPTYAELLLTSRQDDSKATKLDKDMAMAIEEDVNRLASMKKKCSGVRIFHQLSLSYLTVQTENWKSRGC